MRRYGYGRIMNEARIKLAEAMGWRHSTYDSPSFVNADVMVQKPCWYSPDHGVPQIKIPDPFTDANDCEALIKHLESKGIEVTVEFDITEDYVVIRRIPADPNLLIWKGDDWKQGVCELALKVLEIE